MTLNGVMAVTLHYFTEFGKPVYYQHITASNCGGIYARVKIIGYSSIIVLRVRCRRRDRKFTFAISSPDEILVISVSDRRDC